MKNIDAEPLAEQLELGLAVLELDVSDAQQAALIDYLIELLQWNQAYNLTAIRDPAQMVSHHLLDSLSITPWIGDGSLLDVGAGAGLPGIPLAITRPDIEVTLIDSVGKKARFMGHVARKLKLSNVEVRHDRVESCPAEEFDMMVARAFAQPADFMKVAGHCVRSGGIVHAMLGKLPETRESPGFRELETVRLHVPGITGERHLSRHERIAEPGSGE